MAKQGISLTINALSTLVFLVTLGLVVVYYVITTKGAEAARRASRVISSAARSNAGSEVKA